MLPGNLIFRPSFHPFCLFSPFSRGTNTEVPLISQTQHIFLYVSSSLMHISVHILWNDSQSNPNPLQQPLHNFIISVILEHGRGKCRYTRTNRHLSTGHKKHRLQLCLYFCVCLQAPNMLVVKEKKSFSYCFLKLPQGSKQHKIAFPNCWRKWRLYFSNLINISPSEPLEKVLFFQL